MLLLAAGVRPSEVADAWNTSTPGDDNNITAECVQAIKYRHKDAYGIIERHYVEHFLGKQVLGAMALCVGRINEMLSRLAPTTTAHLGIYANTLASLNKIRGDLDVTADAKRPEGRQALRDLSSALKAMEAKAVKAE